jgi:hypothetical protein
MTVAKGFLIIVSSGVAFALAGGLVGYSLGAFAPGYYRGVYGSGREPWFDPVAVGLGLGLSQGLICGVIIGAVVVLAVAWYNSRHRPFDLGFSPDKVPPLPGPGEQGPAEVGITRRPGD